MASDLSLSAFSYNTAIAWLSASRNLAFKTFVCAVGAQVQMNFLNSQSAKKIQLLLKKCQYVHNLQLLCFCSVHLFLSFLMQFY